MLPLKTIKSMDRRTLVTIARTLEIGTPSYHIIWAYVWLLWAYEFQKTKQYRDMRLNLSWFISEIQDAYPRKG